jgi:tetratricopeptide (TPR) repeat protein
MCSCKIHLDEIKPAHKNESNILLFHSGITSQMYNTHNNLINSFLHTRNDELYINEIVGYIEQKMYSNALERIIDNLAKNDDDPYLYALRGYIYEELHKDTNAMNDYNMAIRLDSSYTDAYIRRGVIYLKNEEMDKAFKDFFTAVKIDKMYYLSHFYLGLTCYFNKQYSNSIICLSSALSLNPQCYEAYVYRGMAYYMIGNIVNTTEDFIESVGYNPNSHVIMNELAYLFITEESIYNLENALYYAEKALELNSNPEYYDTLACVYSEKKDFDKAIEYEIKALNIKEDDYYKMMTNIFHAKIPFSEWFKERINNKNEMID